MTRYMLLIPDVEKAWAEKTDEEKQAVFAKHHEFAAALAARGHEIVHAAQLAPPSTARTVRRSGDGLQVTDGPYAESVEQLSGYYLIETPDVDDLVQAVGILAEAESGLELRECLGGE